MGRRAKNGPANLAGEPGWRAWQVSPAGEKNPPPQHVLRRGFDVEIILRAEGRRCGDYSSSRGAS